MRRSAPRAPDRGKTRLRAPVSSRAFSGTHGSAYVYIVRAVRERDTAARRLDHASLSAARSIRGRLYGAIIDDSASLLPPSSLPSSNLDLEIDIRCRSRSRGSVASRNSFPGLAIKLDRPRVFSAPLPRRYPNSHSEMRFASTSLSNTLLSLPLSLLDAPIPTTGKG